MINTIYINQSIIFKIINKYLKNKIKFLYHFHNSFFLEIKIIICFYNCKYNKCFIWNQKNILIFFFKIPIKRKINLIIIIKINNKHIN